MAKARKRLNVTTIAKRADTTAGTVSKVINGHVRNSKALQDICAVLGVDVEECFPKGKDLPG